MTLLRSLMGTAIIAVLLWISPLHAFTKPPVITLTLPEVIYIKAGGKEKSIIKATVPSGFHVQANPASEEYLIPSKLEFEVPEGLAVTEVTYPKGKPFRLQGSESDISVYEGTFEMNVVFSVDKSHPVKELVIPGKLTYQACDDRSCLRPAFTPFELLVRVEKAGN